MTDIFDAKILCKKCGMEMKQGIVNKNGLELRAVKCLKCKDTIIHPADLNGMEQFKDLRDKKFNVKLRIVGNSHTISIPKEIIHFMNERHKEMRRQMDNMVSLWFDDFDTLKVGFLGNDFDDGNVKRSIRDYGKGNVDIIEEQTGNDERGNFKRIRVKKIRRNFE